jgi:hypothetical protein
MIVALPFQGSNANVPVVQAIFTKNAKQLLMGSQFGTV